jgi:CTP synthase
MLKYIFVSGGVISGVGKGITVASIALILKSSGYKVTPIKFENYLNIDAGTINPIEHGDPFLCEDGTEADMDIGSYEKFLDEQMSKENFVTMGQIYKEVIYRERRFEYEGEDVEAIPYITNEIIKRINIASGKKKTDIVIIELGGTAGEYQNVLYYEASRILRLKLPKDVIHIHVSYVPTPPHLGEPKTKPTQLSVRTLNSLGIQPDIIIARSEKHIDKRRRDRFALFCNMHWNEIISSPNLKTIYEVPLNFIKQNLHKIIQKKLSLKYKKPHLKNWKLLIKNINLKKPKKIVIGIVGKYFGTGQYQLKDSYTALFDAIDHASYFNKIEVQTKWIDAEEIEKKGTSIIKNIDGMIVPIGWGLRGAEGMIQAAGFARDNKMPYLGLCYGMQLAVVSFARDILRLEDANTEENDKKTKNHVIHLIPMQKKFISRRAYGGTMRLGAWEAKLKTNTIAYEIYSKYHAFINKKRLIISERHRHRYEFNDKYTKLFEANGLIISARSILENLVEIIELPKKKHPFYFGIQGHPEYKSRPMNPHPVFIEFIKSCVINKHKYLI